MTEREGTPEDFARMFGRQPEPEQSESETDSTEAEAEPSEGKRVEADQEHDAARAHNEFLTELFRGSAEKREADEKFFRSMHPPTKEGEE
jgi:hypothetical protein